MLKKKKRDLEGSSNFIAVEFTHQMLNDHKMFLQPKGKGGVTRSWGYMLDTNDLQLQRCHCVKKIMGNTVPDNYDNYVHP